MAAGRNGVVVGGRTHGECGPLNGLLARISSDGTRRWHEPFESSARDEVADRVLDVAIGASGTIYGVGDQDTSPTTCMGPSDTTTSRAAIQARTPTGRLLWTRVLPATAAHEEATTVDAVGDHLFIGGQRDRQPRRAWLARLSDEGRLVWSRSWGPPAVRASTAALAASRWGDVYVVGRSGRLTFLWRVTPRGERVSRRLVDGPPPTAVATGGKRTVVVTADDTLWRMPA